jgi:hypothetical protein
MKKLFLILAVIGLASFGCTKVDTIIPTVKKVGVIDGSFEAQYGDISIAKDYTSPVAGWNMWTLLRKDGTPVNGTEFITGSAAQIWWSTNGNNPKGLPAGAPYSILIPDEDLRLQLEVLDPTGHETVYFGMTDFNPENVQFPLSIKAIRVGDYLSLNTDKLTSLPGANLTITANFQLANVDIPTTADKVWNPASPFGFDDIKYGSLVPTTVTIPNGSGDFVLYSGNKKKVFGDIIIKITEAASSSTPANTYTITVPANKVGIAGKGTALKLTTTKVGWYDSATIGVTDNDISIDVINVSVDGQDNQGGNNGGNNGGGNNGGGDQGTLPPVYSSILLNFSSPYPIYTGVADNPETAQLGISLIMDYPSAQAFIKSVGSSQQGGEIIDMGQKDLISLLQADHNYLQGPPTTGYSSMTFFIVGHSYIIRYRKSINYLTSNASYHYGIFYVTNMDVDPNNGYRTTGVTINYEGPFDN